MAAAPDSVQLACFRVRVWLKPVHPAVLVHGCLHLLPNRCSAAILAERFPRCLHRTSPFLLVHVSCSGVFFSLLLSLDGAPANLASASIALTLSHSTCSLQASKPLPCSTFFNRSTGGPCRSIVSAWNIFRTFSAATSLSELKGFAMSTFASTESIWSATLGLTVSKCALACNDQRDHSVSVPVNRGRLPSRRAAASISPCSDPADRHTH